MSESIKTTETNQSYSKLLTIKEGTTHETSKLDYPNSKNDDEVEINYTLYIHKSKLRSVSSTNKGLTKLFRDNIDLKNKFSDYYPVEIRSKFNILTNSNNRIYINELVSLVQQMKKGEISLFEINNSITIKKIFSSLKFLLANFNKESSNNNNKNNNNNDNCKSNSVLLKVELIDFSQSVKSKYEMSINEIFEFSKNKKSLGVSLFKEKKYFEACNVFEEAISYLQAIKNNTSNDYKEILISLLLNNANCLNNLSRFESTIVKCQYVINIKEHPKAYYYKAIAEINLGSLELLKEAEKDIIKLKNLLSESEYSIIESLEKLVKEKKIIIENGEKQFLSKLFKKNIYNDKKLPVKKQIPTEINEYNPIVYFDIQVGSDTKDKDYNNENKEDLTNKIHRVEFELFADVVPKTAENFLLLASTKKYKHTIFHRLIKDFMLQGGDYENFNGTGGKSIYGKNFADENFAYSHTQAGLLSMANSGPNKNGSQFFITFKEAPWLDGKHVVFGRVVKGLDFIMSLNNNETGGDDRPLKVIKIVDCDRYEVGYKVSNE